MHQELMGFIENTDKNQKVYLLLDEVQEVENWEKCVNSLFETQNVDIYVTGSNSKLLSSEISTYLTGRFVQIPIFTLSFSEFIDFKKHYFPTNTEISLEKYFEQYLKSGGFPFIAKTNHNQEENYQIIDGIYSTVVTRDISKRHNISNLEMFNRVVRFILENLGKNFSAKTIFDFFKSQQRSISIETIYNYLAWLEEAFIIYRCNRFDIQGKNVLKTQEKYYLSDIGFKYSQFGFSPKSIASVLENIVYLELRRRGFTVYIGKFADKEIDFIATKQNEKVYVQVCRTLPEDSDREIGNLKLINDNYPKYVVTMDSLVCGNVDGIQIVHIKDFLFMKFL
jgi:predicted AAA+ superfamily ATPase